jgi:hypothetical protein
METKTQGGSVVIFRCPTSKPSLLPAWLNDWHGKPPVTMSAL